MSRTGSSPSSRPEAPERSGGGPSGPAGGWIGFLFRHRGLVPVPAILFAIVAARPEAPWTWIGGGAMVLGEGIRLWAAAYLGLTARSSRPVAGKLVTGGPYARTRHPLYWGNLFLTLGFAVASGAGRPWFPLVTAVLFAVLYRGYALREEAVLAEAFPGPYAAYRKRVPRWRWGWMAAVVPAVAVTGGPSVRRALRVEALSIHAEAWLGAALWARAHWFR